MKLRELITEKIDLTTSTPVRMNDTVWLPSSKDLAGEGVQARVYNTGQGVVTKVAVLDDKKRINDNAVKFLELVLANQDNPFFPKIYHARIYRDKEGIKDPMMIVQMEKLTPITNDHIRDVIPYLFDQLKISKPHPDNTNAQKIQVATNDIMRATNTNSPESMAELIKDSKNPQFKKAMKVLMPAMNKLGGDLHYGNWMVRLTSAGPQLVIVDPFSSDVYANMGADNDQ